MWQIIENCNFYIGASVRLMWEDKISGQQSNFNWII